MTNAPFRAKAIIGMVHVQALPGAPFNRLGVEEIATQAAAEARILADAGFDAMIVENMHDRPYAGRHGPETVAAMTRIVLAVRDALERSGRDLPIGVQVLSCGNREALAVAQAAGASFVRAENFVFAHVADEGLLAEAEAPAMLRYRRLIGAEGIKIFADVKKKHASHAITADVPLAEAAEGAEFFGADGLVVTGTATGKPTRPEDVAAVRAAVGGAGLPVLVGSGVTPETIPELFEHADGLIVGSWYKQEGRWLNPPDPERCRALMEAAERARRA